MIKQDEWWQPESPYSLLYPKTETAGVNASTEYVTRQVDCLERYLRLDRRSRVLEVACGTGEVTIELARRGYATTAIDINGNYLSQARERAKGLGVYPKFIKADMRHLDIEGGFDAVFSCGSSIGIFRDEQENIKVFSEMARIIRPGGILLVESWTDPTTRKETNFSREKPNKWRETLSDGATVDITAWWEGGRIFVVIHDMQSSKHIQMDYRIYNATKLRAVLRSLQLRPQPVIYLSYHNWKEVSRAKYARRMVMIAEK